MNEIVDNVYLSEDLAPDLKNYLEGISFSQLFLLMDKNTAQFCLPKANQVFPNTDYLIVEPGEENKNLETCQKIWEKMTAANLDRQAIMINLGGGVIGDMGGFCASTYKRGIRFINIPTTLLSQVDASIGGKQGVDFMNYKNHIGVFNDPEAVFINPQFLDTLPEDEALSGYAEIVKHALIDDKGFWDQLVREEPNLESWNKHIPRAVAVKAKIVKSDPKEGGARKLLNFGHTLGHAVESYLLSTKNRKILHGEGVAAGMIMEAWISHQIGLLSSADFQALNKYIKSVFPKINYQSDEIEDIARYLLQDKKNVGKEIRCSLLKQLGEGVYDQNIDYELCKEAMQHYHHSSY